MVQKENLIQYPLLQFTHQGFIAKSYIHAVPTKRKILPKEQRPQQREQTTLISFNLTPHCSLGNDL